MFSFLNRGPPLKRQCGGSPIRTALQVACLLLQVQVLPLEQVQVQVQVQVQAPERVLPLEQVLLWQQMRQPSSTP